MTRVASMRRPTMTDPRPLSAEDWLRDIAANAFVMDVSLRGGGRGDLMPGDIAEVLATLDAERVRHAALVEAAGEAARRMEVEFAYLEATPGRVVSGGVAASTFRPMAAALRAALDGAEEAAAAPAPLDPDDTLYAEGDSIAARATPDPRPLSAEDYRETPPCPFCLHREHREDVCEEDLGEFGECQCADTRPRTDYDIVRAAYDRLDATLTAERARHAALVAAAREWRDALDAYTTRPWGKAEQARYSDARSALRAALAGEPS